mmetsp:Transcript_9421/g.27684  ORF Transcript_9421/g.27684 Transcript_9421/m.27684 type:complete len:232 (-) Transcript_9421:779-1474(-)
MRAVGRVPTIASSAPTRSPSSLALCLGSPSPVLLPAAGRPVEVCCVCHSRICGIIIRMLAAPRWHRRLQARKYFLPPTKHARCKSLQGPQVVAVLWGRVHDVNLEAALRCAPDFRAEVLVRRDEDEGGPVTVAGKDAHILVQTPNELPIGVFPLCAAENLLELRLVHGFGLARRHRALLRRIKNRHEVIHTRARQAVPRKHLQHRFGDVLRLDTSRIRHILDIPEHAQELV